MCATKTNGPPKSARRANKRLETTRLTRDDWLDAAFSAVVDGGIDNARVLVIANTLGVTRGSFYWHFTDHAELLAALLARWRQRETDANLRMTAAFTEDPKADLGRLLDAALAHVGVDLEHMRFELALRGLGRRDPVVAAMLFDVDQMRMSLFEGKFLRLTGDQTAVTELASLFYVAIIGSHQALSRPSTTPRLKQYLRGIIADYLIHRQVPARFSTPLIPGKAR